MRIGVLAVGQDVASRPWYFVSKRDATVMCRRKDADWAENRLIRLRKRIKPDTTKFLRFRPAVVPMILPEAEHYVPYNYPLADQRSIASKTYDKEGRVVSVRRVGD